MGRTQHVPGAIVIFQAPPTCLPRPGVTQIIIFAGQRFLPLQEYVLVYLDSLPSVFLLTEISGSNICRTAAGPARSGISHPLLIFSSAFFCAHPTVPNPRQREPRFFKKRENFWVEIFFHFFPFAVFGFSISPHDRPLSLHKSVF